MLPDRMRTPSALTALLHRPFVQGLAKLQVGSVVTMATGLASSILFSRLLGLEQYGYYAVVVAFAGIVTIVASLGQEITLTTFLSEAAARKNARDIRSVLIYFLQVSAVTTVIYLLLILAAPLLADLLQGDARAGEIARLAILNAALQWPAVLLFLSLQLNKRIGTMALLENARSILQVALGTLFLVLGLGVEGILLGQLFISLLYVPLCLLLYRRARVALGFPSLESLVPSILRQHTGTYWKQGFWISVDRSIANNIYPNAFFMVLNAVASLEIVGLFRLALRLAELPRSLVMPSISRMANVAIPRLTTLDRKSLKRACIQLMAGSFGLHLLAIIGAAIFVPPLLPYVYGTAFVGAIPAFLLLLPTNLFASLQVVAVPLLRLFKKMHVSILANLFGIAVALIVFFSLSSALSPLIAMCMAVLIVYANSNTPYLYLWYQIEKHKGLKPSSPAA